MREYLALSMTSWLKRELMRRYEEKGDVFFDEFERETGKAISPKTRADLIRFWKGEDIGLTVSISNKYHLLAQAEVREFGTILALLRWKVYLNRTEKKFITSDNPVSVIGRPALPKDYDRSDLRHVFALSPDLCLEMKGFWHKDEKFIHRRTLTGREGEAKILELNAITAHCANESAFARDAQSLQDVLDSKWWKTRPPRIVHYPRDADRGGGVDHTHHRQRETN
jgi:hypothetical protein